MKEAEQSNNAREGIPLTQPNPGAKKASKICECSDCKNPCLHFLARTAQHDKLKAQFRKTFFSDDLLVVNKQLRTILHCAANYTGDPRKANKCVELILEEILRRNLSLEDFVNARDEGDLTALYLSVKNENTFVCKTLIQQGGADLDIDIGSRSWSASASTNIRSKRRKTAIQKLFKKMPVVIENFLELVADSIKYTDDDLSTISVDLGLIIGYPTTQDIELNKPSMYEETDFLSNLCYTPIEQRAAILTHPVVKAFVHLKWRKIESLFWIARAFQITWALAYFWFVMEVYRKLCPYPASKQFKFTWLNFIPVLDDPSNTTDSDTEAIRNCRSDAWINVVACVLLTLATFDLLYFEIHPTFVRFRRYWYPMKTVNMRKCFKRALLFLRILHLEKMFLLFTIFLNVLPLLAFSILDPLGEWQYISASLGVFLTWVHVFFQVGKIPQLTVYVRMLEKVLSTLSVITLIYVSLIYAFGMVFCILLPGVASYSSPFQAILKMTTFLIGEVEYESFFYEEHSSGISVSLSASMLFYGIAILVLHIALLNFLVGLTVADVQNVERYAEVWKSFRHVWEISLLESFLSRCPAGIGLPLLRKIALQQYDARSSQIDASESGSNKSINHEAEIRLEDLLKPLRKQIRKIILDRENQGE